MRRSRFLGVPAHGAIVEREHLILRGLDEEELFQPVQNVRVLCREVTRLRPIGSSVVQFPTVFVESR